MSDQDDGITTITVRQTTRDELDNYLQKRFGTTRVPNDVGVRAALEQATEDLEGIDDE